MIIKTSHFGLQTGYAFWCDLPVGFTLCLFKRRYREEPKDALRSEIRYKLIIEVGWDWLPTIIYYDKNWRIDEPNMIKGLPIRRQKRLWWPIRQIKWNCAARWHWQSNAEVGSRIVKYYPKVVITDYD